MRRLFGIAATLAALFLAVPAFAAAAQTIVSVTFDDGWGNQLDAAPILASHAMDGTFYVNGNAIGTSGFLSWAQLEALNADGNEVGGHTLDHPDLTTVSSDEARRQVCDDRAIFISRGFVVPSFAYPFGAYDPTVQAIVRECGYASGRGAFGLRNVTATTDSRPYAETIPPANPYAILTPCCIRSDTPLLALQDYIMKAEASGGGWVPLVLHRICTGCGDDPAPSMSPATLDALLAWLEPRAAQGTVVRTVGQVVSGDAAAPDSSIACNASACSAWYRSPVTVTLSSTDAGSGVVAIRYTTDGSEPTVSSPLYSGPVTVSAPTAVKYRAWDTAGNVEATKSQLIRFDTEGPTIAIVSPKEGETVRGVVKVSANASDAVSGVAKVSFYANGVLIGTKTGAPYTVNWNTRKVTRGPYALTAVADDVAGNSRTSAPINVTVAG